MGRENRRSRLTAVLEGFRPSGSSKDQDWRRERLAVYQIELRALTEDLEENGARSRYTDYAEKLLARAEEALERGDVESFWEDVSAAKRWELKVIADVETPVERNSREPQGGLSHLELRAQRILSEATDALSAERARQIQDLLAGFEERSDEPRAADVLTASRLLYDGHVAEYRDRRRYRVVERQLLYFTVVGLATAVAVILTWSGEEYELDVPVAQYGPWLYSDTYFLVLIPLFGVLGATTSSLLSLTRGLSGTRLPDRIGSLGLTIARVTIGGASAIVIYTFLVAGLLNVVVVTPGTVFAFSFVSGFTERLLVRAVEAVTGTPTDRE